MLLSAKRLDPTGMPKSGAHTRGHNGIASAAVTVQTPASHHGGFGAIAATLAAEPSSKRDASLMLPADADRQPACHVHATPAGPGIAPHCVNNGGHTHDGRPSTGHGLNFAVGAAAAPADTLTVRTRRRPASSTSPLRSDHGEKSRHKKSFCQNSPLVEGTRAID
jgi:hypothetical protein